VGQPRRVCLRLRLESFVRKIFLKKVSCKVKAKRANSRLLRGLLSSDVPTDAPSSKTAAFTKTQSTISQLTLFGRSVNQQWTRLLNNATLAALPNHYGGFRLDTRAQYTAKRDAPDLPESAASLGRFFSRFSGCDLVEQITNNERRKFRHC
jgi:hypothetical protein